MNVSYNNEELLEEVRQDMIEFGEELGVIAIYSVFPENQDKYYITDYIWGEPVHDSDMDIYEEEMKLHEKELATLEYTKHEKMTIKELYNNLLKQSKII
ncbi:hypothetical protein [Ligilactobacillus salivarius]|uniref:Uncharacterized protein n=1 Tax=Ligilactobacillus salivarius TaxID=1624 RepID=A0A1V9U277_9LACO|nr:hypothetical protein [Ligilactobacillus salivarius]OQR21839.1 hypothetical protein B6U39_02775 [Ligilactobacillus salivarius]OQR23774.1 hypothetical protein B6U38_02800 [Ligilactobacillus salivarius]OQR25763.1 hypothetical protein B6U37_02785 [Ligilactobacillus salivarius]